MPLSADNTLEELFKFRLTQLKDDFEQTTANVSQTVRVASYGLAALVIPLVTVEPTKVPIVIQHRPWWVVLAAALGVVAVILDIGQNWFAASIAWKELQRLNNNLNQKKLELDSPADFMFLPENEKMLKGREGCYYLKILVTAIGLVIVMSLIVLEVPRGLSPSPSMSAIPAQPGLKSLKSSTLFSAALRQ